MAKCTGMRCPMQYGYKVDECNHMDCPYRTEPMTNADRIRAMSDEELADVVKCPHTGNWDLCEDNCFECRMKWLQQPTKENDYENVF